MSRSENPKTPKERALAEVTARLRERLNSTPEIAQFIRLYHKNVVTPLRGWLQENHSDPDQMEALLNKTAVKNFKDLMQTNWHSKTSEAYESPEGNPGYLQFGGFYTDMVLALKPQNITPIDQELWKTILAELPNPENN